MGLEPIMGGGNVPLQIILFPIGLAAVMDDIGRSFFGALIGNDPHVPPAEHHKIPRLPLGDLVGVGGQALGVLLKKDLQIGHPTEMPIVNLAAPHVDSTKQTFEWFPTFNEMDRSLKWC